VTEHVQRENYSSRKERGEGALFPRKGRKHALVQGVLGRTKGGMKKGEIHLTKNSHLEKKKKDPVGGRETKEKGIRESVEEESHVFS